MLIGIPFCIHKHTMSNTQQDSTVVDREPVLSRPESVYNSRLPGLATMVSTPSEPSGDLQTALQHAAGLLQQDPPGKFSRSARI